MTPESHTGAGLSMSESRNSSSPNHAKPQDEIEAATVAGTLEHDFKVSPAPSHNVGQLSLDDVVPVNVHVRNLGVTVNTAPSWSNPATYAALAKQNFHPNPEIKTLLQDVSASFAPGTLTAIIGGSGSGKTTLLNTIAERMNSSRLALSGTTIINGQSRIQAARHAYVMQQDVLLAALTVRETLAYSAALRLPSSISAQERDRVVEEVILELGLKECANTRIGNSQHRGCSGGEKRRVSIGVQMLSNPSLLFLDEPTTGLDATSAFQLVRTLKALAAKGRTVITTIHQPRSEIWDLFDNLVILSKGSPVYSGSREGCINWFDDQGFALPPFVNPAEHMIDIAAIDNRSPELESASKERVDRLKAAWREESSKLYSEVTLNSEKESKGLVDKHNLFTTQAHASFSTQMKVLSERTLKVTYRDPMGMLAAIVETTIMGLVSGLIFYNLGRDAAGIRSREGALYSGAALQGYLMLLFEVYRLTIDMPTFDREHNEGCVDPLPFILSRRVARFPTEDLPVPLIYSVIMYFMAGFDREAKKFFIFFGISLLNHYIAMTCAMILGSGMFIQSNTLPVYVRWLKYITYTWYCVGAYSGNEFEGGFYDCPYEGGISNPACESYTGRGIMKNFGLPQNWVARPIAVLVGFVFFFIAITYVLLLSFKPEMAIARARTSDDFDLSAGKEKMSTQDTSTVRAIDFSLRDFSLDLDKRSTTGKKLLRKRILDSVTATFKAGEISVIMGPSGSGKTSLLNSMALRLRNSIGTHYITSGKLLFNDAEPSASVVRAICSYVCQDDDGLLPSLTVRETLRFAAGLRLPKWMSAAEKDRQAEQVLLKLGLKDCADNLIGNDLIKGISGGEKRRVSIAVQILTDPRILLLDEPTSGLDAFTANSIMDVLHGLAAEGRTVILTIHQARSDLFDRFGSMLLLARGGLPVYAGPATFMFPYFSQHGFACPAHSNPADFALDLITIDLQEQTREDQSRDRVQNLINAWRAANTFQTIPDARRKFSSPAELGAMTRTRASFFSAAPLVMYRAIINMRRQPPLMMARIMQVFSLAVLMALFFAPLKNNYYSVQNRMGLIQQMGGFYFTGMLQNVAVYPAERDVFYRENDDGVYSVSAFLLTYTLLEVPFEVVASLMSAVFIVFVIGLTASAPLFFVTAFACFGVVSCGESVGILFNTLFTHSGFAVTLTSVVLSLANSMAGILSTDMPGILNAMNYLSPIRYATRAMAPYSLRGEVFTCTREQRTPTGQCQISTGEQVLQLYNMDGDAVANVAGSKRRIEKPPPP
ncbi:hypothetical protein TD95_000538 [Thielaviopsis punctulata]|uniref:ABC transporter domain-containing protein n=1 Tax=Thielaviopsis punctulata TaxID=72032 RepID=A0A0F4Z8Z9_9PEZI|nr:hypothetical protein TD95_000538 [Thielaviopsis punctulata]